MRMSQSVYRSMLLYSQWGNLCTVTEGIEANGLGYVTCGYGQNAFNLVPIC